MLVHVPIVRFRAPVVMRQESRHWRECSRGATRAGRIAPVTVKRILAVPEPSGRAVTWAREAAERFEAELVVLPLDPAEADPAAAIVREASERGSDLIVLSDAGMRDRTEFLLANVANRVSHAARCSVVFVADGSAPRASEEPRERLLGRAAEIGRVFARHGLRDDRPAADRARRLREALEELGPTFAKLGQVLSTRPDLLPPEYIAELARLQDDMPPLSQAEVVTVLESELGVPWEDALAHIDPIPLAAGTIAQVHRASLPDGSAVVLKVQRPSARAPDPRGPGAARAVRGEGGKPPGVRARRRPARRLRLPLGVAAPRARLLDRGGEHRAHPAAARRASTASTRRACTSSSRPGACS